MKKIVFFCFLLSTLLTNAQLNVNNTLFSPADLILSKLIGDGISVSNVKYNGSVPNALITNNQLGFYTTGVTPTNLGLSSGLLMTNGSATGAIGPNSVGGSTTASNFPVNGDPDLAMIASLSINNICILEFDFIPVGPEVKFEYVFASEEYPEFVGTSFNDVFGFFLSGPGITGPYSNGAKNIALLPNSTTAISINNVNPGLNSSYYVSNPAGGFIQYDGFTTVLTARSEVQCGQTYHIKLALADVGDSAYDSAVFFKEDSFSVPNLNLGGDMVGPSKACCGDKLSFSTPFNLTDYPGAVHEWYFENVLVFTSSTSNQFIFDNPSCTNGTLKVVVKPYPTQACTFDDEIVIQYQYGPTLNTPPPLTLCSDTPATATGQFNLNMQINNIIPSYNADYEELGFYTTRDDAYNNVNAIPVASWSAYNGTENQSIFLGVSNIILTGNVCRSVMEFKLKFVNCDDVDCSLNPSSAVFNLTNRKPIILNGFDPTKYSISFHQSMANAVAGILPITPENAYSLTTNPEEIYVRYWENAVPVNRQFTQFTLLANQANFAGNDGNLVFCKDDTITFNLFDYISGEQAGGTWSVVSGSGANLNLAAGTIASNNSPANYVLEYRVDASSSCPADISTLNVTINPVCGVQTPPDLILCDDSSNNGIEIFDLSVQNTTILGSLSSADYTISYHDDSTDVLSGASPISPITAYPNTSNPQTIYIRVIKNSDGSVFDTSKTFQLLVKPQPVVSNFTGTTTICFGSSTGLVFSGTPNTTIIYTDGTTNQSVAIGSTGSETVLVSPNFTTTYSLISIASNSTPICTSPASGSVTVTVNQLPLLSSTPLNGEACFGEQWTQNFFGTPNATITLTDGTNTYNVVLDATGTQTWVSPALTVNTTFTLINIASATIPVCNQSLTVPFTISLVPLATASAIGNTTCINTSGQLNFTGSPFSTVSFTDGTTAYTQLLDSSGVGVWNSPILASNTTYTLTYVTSGSPNVVCDNTLSSTATITVNPNNTVSPASSSPVLCVNTNLPIITHTTTGATGIGTPT
ncbi:choice-of-anchor L domain-containing protein, partial [Flavobacterium difficile]